MKFKSGTILIIDDNPLLLLNYSEILEASGYLCMTAKTIKQATHLIKSREFGLIVCDHDLPDGKGIDLIKAVSSSKKDIPFLYISAAIPAILNQVESLASVKTALVKPVTQNVLVATVDEYFSKSENDLFPRLIGNQERSILLNQLSA